MFPTGLPGVGLIGGSVHSSSHAPRGWITLRSDTSMGGEIGSLVAAVCLVIGILTPYAASFAGCLEFWRLCTRDNVDLFHLIAATVVTLALGVLGPGAYSVDNRIFGRRLVNVPHGSEGNPSG